MIDPMNTTEVAVEQRLVGLMSATRTLRNLNEIPEGREVIRRPKCLENIELVRDQLTSLLSDLR